MLFQVSLTSIWLSAISSTVVRLSASVATSSEQAQSLQRGEERRRRGRKQDWNSNSRFLTVPLARPLAFPPSCFACVVINFSHSCSLRLWHCPPLPASHVVLSLVSSLTGAPLVLPLTPQLLFPVSLFVCIQRYVRLSYFLRNQHNCDFKTESYIYEWPGLIHFTVFLLCVKSRHACF